jgi:hypothetical protein
MIKKLLISSLILTSVIALAAPSDHWEITYYQTAAKQVSIGSTTMMCGRVFHEGKSSKHFTKDILGPC